jgi:hypothetical protein
MVYRVAEQPTRMPFNPLVLGFQPRLKIDIPSFRSGSQPIGKLLPSLIWIHSQYVTPKRKPVFVLKQPSCCGFLLAAQLISGVVNRLRDYSGCQSTEGICSPLDLGEGIGFHRNGHFGSSPVHNPRDRLPHREGEGNHHSNCDGFLRNQKTD